MQQPPLLLHQRRLQEARGEVSERIGVWDGRGKWVVGVGEVEREGEKCG